MDSICFLQGKLAGLDHLHGHIQPSPNKTLPPRPFSNIVNVLNDVFLICFDMSLNEVGVNSKYLWPNKFAKKIPVTLLKGRQVHCSAQTE